MCTVTKRPPHNKQTNKIGLRKKNFMVTSYIKGIVNVCAQLRNDHPTTSKQTKLDWEKQTSKKYINWQCIFTVHWQIEKKEKNIKQILNKSFLCFGIDFHEVFFFISSILKIRVRSFWSQTVLRVNWVKLAIVSKKDPVILINIIIH